MCCKPSWKNVKPHHRDLNQGPFDYRAAALWRSFLLRPGPRNLTTLSARHCLCCRSLSLTNTLGVSLFGLVPSTVVRHGTASLTSTIAADVMRKNHLGLYEQPCHLCCLWDCKAVHACANAWTIWNRLCTRENCDFPHFISHTCIWASYTGVRD